MPALRKKPPKKTEPNPLVTKAISWWKFGVAVLTDPAYTWRLSIALLVIEAVLNVFIVNFVKYTEIDWIAYMQEVEGFLNGTTDYMKLKGDTGPLVYPAGFVYIYSALYYVTNFGKNIKFGQYLFSSLYLINFFLVVRIYDKTRKCPPYVLMIMTFTSYRIHSIFVLRLFNDPVAMTILYAAVNFFISRKWEAGCALFSLAVSVKMNILLFAPALLIILLNETGLAKTVLNLLLCAAIQVVLALPFLWGNATGYMVRSFDLGRQFFYVWTVNWRLIPEELFLNKNFQLTLLACHLLFLFVFAIYRWTGGFRSLFSLIDPRGNWGASRPKLSVDKMVLMLFTSNFIGMCFSRSLHYQFYVWYYHTLPYLLWHVNLNSFVRILILGLLELSWNTYPSTVVSSSTLHIMHFMMIVGLLFIPLPTLSSDNTKKVK